MKRAITSNLRSLSIVMLLSINIFSCKKLVELPPPKGSIVEASVFSTNSTATAVLTGVYINMSKPGIFTGRVTNNSLHLLTALSGDDYTLYNGATNAKLIAYYKNNLSVLLNVGHEFWAPLFSYILQVNIAIEGISKSETLSTSVKQQLLGECKFLRSFFYFYLLNYFGEVPLALTSDYKVNSFLSRSPKTEVYKQIVKDLSEAQLLLSDDYLNQDLKPYSGIIEKVRPNKSVATALLARAYLFSGDWINAELEASKVINKPLYDTVALNKVFLKNSKEAIWQLQPVNNGFNTQEGPCFIIPATGFTNNTPVHLSSRLLNEFETNDQRRYGKNWIDSIKLSNNWYYFPFKYKIYQSNSTINSTTGTTNMSEYLMVFRLAEQYLIRAEARANLGNLSGALSDLNVIRKRAGLSLNTVTNKEILLKAILHERQVELFSEWGHRWLDLKRTNNIDAVMSIVTPTKSNGTPWQSYQQLYPIPLIDLSRNINLTQNPGF